MLEEESGLIKRVLFPQPMPSSREYSEWLMVPDEKKGKVTELYELLNLKFDENRRITLTREHENFNYYGIDYGNESIQNIAYKCNGCKVTSFGPPKIIDDISLREINVPMLCGKEAYTVYCGHCNYLFEENVLKAS